MHKREKSKSVTGVNNFNSKQEGNAKRTHWLQEMTENENNLVRSEVSKRTIKGIRFRKAENGTWRCI